MLEQVDHVGEVVGTGHAVDPDPSGPGRHGVGAAGLGHGHDPHLVAVEQVDRGPVEPGSIEPDHGGVGLAGAGGGEQVVDVDAALEQHQARPLGDQREQRRLPGCARADHQDDDHVSPGRPR